MNRSISVAAVLAVLAAGMAQSPAAVAQGGKQMYRCGSNYQDRPCDGSAPTAAKSASAAGGAAKAAPAADPAKGGTAGSTAAATAGATASAPVLTKAQQQRQIRCENFGRQRDELKERQKASPNQAEAVGVQIRSLESRMSADGC